MENLEKRCSTCDRRHSPCEHYPPDNDECSHWILGQCYTCKYINAPDEEWFKRGCEANCCSGCEKYKRDWKKTWKLIKQKLKL